MNTQRLRAVTEQTGIDVFLSNHAEWDGSIEKMNRLRAGSASSSHPLSASSEAAVPAAAGR